MKTIKGLERLEETTLRLGGCGDNWHMTWADDDKQCVSMCDGTGLPGTPYSSPRQLGQDRSLLIYLARDEIVDHVFITLAVTLLESD